MERNQITISLSDLSHIFRNATGHLLNDTPAHRQLLIDTALDPGNFLGNDKYGTEWYAKINSDGTQIWVQVRNGIIKNGGVNQTPKPFNPQTGLSKISR